MKTKRSPYAGIIQIRLKGSAQSRLSRLGTPDIFCTASGTIAINCSALSDYINIFRRCQRKSARFRAIRGLYKKLFMCYNQTVSVFYQQCFRFKAVRGDIYGRRNQTNGGEKYFVAQKTGEYDPASARRGAQLFRQGCFKMGTGRISA